MSDHEFGGLLAFPFVTSTTFHLAVLAGPYHLLLIAFAPAAAHSSESRVCTYITLQFHQALSHVQVTLRLFPTMVS
jgi:hypothetical protein